MEEVTFTISFQTAFIKILLYFLLLNVDIDILYLFILPELLKTRNWKKIRFFFFLEYSSDEQLISWFYKDKWEKWYVSPDMIHLFI